MKQPQAGTHAEAAAIAARVAKSAARKNPGVQEHARIAADAARRAKIAAQANDTKETRRQREIAQAAAFRAILDARISVC